MSSHLTPDLVAQGDQIVASAKTRLQAWIDNFREHAKDHGGQILCPFAEVGVLAMENPREVIPDLFAAAVLRIAIHETEKAADRIETIAELERVPWSAVVRSDAGTIACRFDANNGVVFGDDRPFPWLKLALPAQVIWRPDR